MRFFVYLLLIVSPLLTTGCYSVHTLREAGWSAEDDGDYTQAITYYTQALAMDSLCYWCYVDRSYAYRQTQQPVEAIHDLDRAIAISPASSQGYFNRATLYYALQRYDLAIEDYTTLTKMRPADLVPYLYRGKSYAYRKQYDEALRDYNFILRDAPSYYQASAGRAGVYYDKEEYEHALTDYGSAIESLYQVVHTSRQIPKPDLLRPSKTREIQKKTEEKVQNLSHILASYFRARARTYQQLQQYDLALEDYNESLLWDSTTAVAYVNIGWLHYLANDFANCITSSQTALRIDSNDLTARYNIALSYLRLGNMEEARQQYSNTLAYAEANTRAIDSLRTSRKPLFTPYVVKAREDAIGDLQSLLQRDIYAEEIRGILHEIFDEKFDAK